MQNAVNWFEIPTTNLDRATKFYETVLGIRLRREDFGGTPMSIFALENPEAVSGALVADPNRRPGADGALVYLDARGDLAGALARTPAAGGKVVLPLTSIGPQGHIAIVLDTEGNSVGLHVP